MRHRWFPVVVVVVVLVFPVPAAAQSGADDWTAPRTPWGDPDLQGLWTSATLTPLERPGRQADREELTDEEAAALERQTIENRAANDGKATPGSVGGYNQVWLDAGTAITETRRTSLIIDPPEGVIPWTEGSKEASDRERARYGVGRSTPGPTWTPASAASRTVCPTWSHYSRTT